MSANNKIDNIAVWGVIFVILSIVSLSYYDLASRKEHIREWTANAPIRFLAKGQHLYNQGKYMDCIDELRRSVKVIKSIENHSDSTGITFLENSISDLNTIISSILEESSSVEEVNAALFESLNAIAYTELEISKMDLENGEYEKGYVLMKTSLHALKKSKDFVSPRDELKEEKVVNDLIRFIDSLEHSYVIDGELLDVINHELTEILLQDY